MNLSKKIKSNNAPVYCENVTLRAKALNALYSTKPEKFVFY